MAHGTDTGPDTGSGADPGTGTDTGPGAFLAQAGDRWSVSFRRQSAPNGRDSSIPGGFCPVGGARRQSSV